MGNRDQVACERAFERSPAGDLHRHGAPESINTILDVLRQYGALYQGSYYSSAPFYTAGGRRAA